MNPARDYDIDPSESEITCHYSISRAQGGSCATYDIGNPIDNPYSSPRSELALELHCRTASSEGGSYRSHGPNTESISGGGGIIKKN